MRDWTVAIIVSVVCIMLSAPEAVAADARIASADWPSFDRAGRASGRSSADSLWPAVDLSGVPIFGGATGAQTTPDIARGSTSYLAVWSDDRKGSARIFAARITSDGTLVDTTGFCVCEDGSWQSSPAVAFDGGNWMVVWYESSSGGRIVGVRVAQDGTVLDPAPFVIDTGDGWSEWVSSPEISFGGPDYLVVYGRTACMEWDEYNMCIDTDRSWHGRFVSQEGVPEDNFAIASSAYAADYGYDVSFDGSNYLFVWGYQSGPSTYQVRGQFIDTTGDLVWDARFLWSGSSAPAGVSLAHIEGHGYLVTWSDPRNGDTDVFLARVLDSGTTLYGFTVGHLSGDQSYPQICAVGSMYTIVWRDLRDPIPAVYAARVDTAATVLDSGGVRLFDTGDLTQYTTASDGAVSLIVWDDAQAGGSQTDLFGARFDTAGTLLDPAAILIAPGANCEKPVKVAFGGANYLLVWQDGRGEDAPDIYCARVDAGGTLLDVYGVPVAVGAGAQTSPAVSFDGTNYLVAWTDLPPGQTLSDVRCARVTPSAVVVDVPSIDLAVTSAWEYNPSVCFDGENHVVAWNASGTLRAARLSPSGTVLDPSGIVVATSVRGLHIARGDTTSLIVYEPAQYWNYNIYAKRFGRDGTVLDPTAISVAVHTSHEIDPEAAFGGGEWLISWGRYNSASSSYDIHAGRVTTAGTTLDGSYGFAVSTAVADQLQPAVCFEGEDFLVSWSDMRSGASSDIYCARVGTDGVVRDEAGICAGALPGDQVLPAVAATGTGDALLVYSSYEGDLGAQRIWGNRWSPAWVGVDDQPFPGRLVLSQNQPNPFGPRTTLRFTLPADGGVCLDVYDAAGRRVRRLVDHEHMAPGAHFVEWDGEDDSGHAVASGVYFVKLVQGEWSAGSKVVLAR